MDVLGSNKQLSTILVFRLQNLIWHNPRFWQVSSNHQNVIRRNIPGRQRPDKIRAHPNGKAGLHWTKGSRCRGENKATRPCAGKSTPKEYRWILDQIPELVKSEGISDLRGGGYRIYTTINAQWQQAAHKSLMTELDTIVRDRLGKKRKVKSRAKWLKKRQSKWGKKNPPLGADVQAIVVETDEKSVIDVGKGKYRWGAQM